MTGTCVTDSGRGLNTIATERRISCNRLNYTESRDIDIVGDEVYHNKFNIPRRLTVCRVQTAAVLAVAPGRSVSGVSASSSVPRPVYLKPTIFYLGGEIEHR